MFAYWGKADTAYDGEPGWHPLVWHSLEVAAVAEALLARRPFLLRSLAESLGCSHQAAARLAVLLIGLHDLGKFADNFQRKRPDLYQAAFPLRVSLPLDSSCRHDVIGWTFWCSTAANQLRAELGSRLPGWDDDQLKNVLAPSCGHHGLPPTNVGNETLGNAMASAARADALSFALRWIEFSWPAEVPVETIPCPKRPEFEWLLAGIAVLSDWLGSNTRWFRYAPPPSNPDQDWTQHWQLAQTNAQQALVESGVLQMPPTPYLGPAAVLDSNRPPRPMQQAVMDLALASGPQLVIIEDSTGAGKTEAALLLAHRLLDAGRIEGLYFGLPTQATANGLFERLSRIAPALLIDHQQASMVLAHGASGLHPAFRELLGRPVSKEPRNELETASMGLSAWLAESRKRALLAQIGVGTLDQSLLAALRSKHNALRVLGLVGKLLIVDEVHAYDPYMLEVLTALLDLHARLGGSVVLLSATLPVSTRRALLGCYWKVLRPAVARRGPQPKATPLPTLLKHDCYPLLTSLDATGVCELEVDSLPAARRAIRIRYISEREEVMRAVLLASQSGQCVGWIHNTVAEAQRSFQALRARIDQALPVRLFHARFAFCDRLRIENRIRADFGPTSKAAARKGQIVIATQVIEQSLDLDFDLLVSDLAPIDLLLQRFGRWRRHARDPLGDRVEGPDQRAESAVIVHGPVRVTEPAGNWLRSWSAGTAMVYRNVGQLYLSAKALGDCIQLPLQQRALIEQVYGDEAQDQIPAALAAASERAEGDELGQRSVAAINTIDWQKGYQRDLNSWPDDMRVATRVGDPTIDVALGRCGATGIEPWTEATPDYPSPFERWAMSVVRVRADQLCARAELADPAREAAARLLELESPYLRWRVLLPLIRQPDGQWLAQGLRDTGDKGEVAVAYRYSPEVGLVQIKEGSDQQ